jgi:hypothetical protein
MMESSNQNIEALTCQLCTILDEQYTKSMGTNISDIGRTFLVTPGRKYFKIVMYGTYKGYIESPAGSVHAFVDKKTGSVYKPAGWAQPAKGARYNLTNDMETLKVKANWHGGYLYRGA